MDSKRINIDEYLYKYGLHDTVVDKIYVQGDELVFCFDSGIYILDENGKEMEKTSKCLMCIKIEGFDIKKAFEHIEIYEFYKDKKIR
ncbi:MAG TPA: hypothetical protein DCY93_01335 [Firmicutes bacterium]|nr:hypothetical protein [Bacillota bacterium]